MTKEQGGTWATGPGGYLIILGLSTKGGRETPGPPAQPLMYQGPQQLPGAESGL